MEGNAINQAYLFVMFILNGILVGILFDIFRILRKSFKTPDLITYLEDIIFWIIAGLLTLYSIFKFNNGEIRIYIFVAIIVGVLMYMMTLSKYFIKLNVFIISTIKKVIGTVISTVLYPFKVLFRFLKKIFIQPITFICINFNKIFKKIIKYLQNTKITTKKSKNTQKNTVQKEDFNI